MKLNSTSLAQASVAAYVILLGLNVVLGNAIIVNYGSVIMHAVCYAIAGYAFGEVYNMTLKRR